jgi:hypothetical protein
MQIGTDNNIERTGDRDLDFSTFMRSPKGVKVCDIDPSPVCPMCGEFKAIFEAKRVMLPDKIWALRNTEYVRKLAARCGVEAYLLCSINKWENMFVIGLKDFVFCFYNKEEAVSWIQHIPCPFCKIGENNVSKR